MDRWQGGGLPRPDSPGAELRTRKEGRDGVAAFDKQYERSALRGFAENLKLYVGNAGAQDAEFGGGGAGQVDDAAGCKGATVIDANHDGAAAAQIGDADDGAERKRLVRGGQLGVVEGLAGGGLVTLEDVAVPGGDAAKRIAEGGQRTLDGANGVKAAQVAEAVVVERFHEAAVLFVGASESLGRGGYAGKRSRRCCEGGYRCLVPGGGGQDCRGCREGAGEQGCGDERPVAK